MLLSTAVSSLAGLEFQVGRVSRSTGILFALRKTIRRVLGGNAVSCCFRLVRKREHYMESEEVRLYRCLTSMVQ